MVLALHNLELTYMTLTQLLTASGSTWGNHTKNRQQSSQHKPLLLTTALFVSLILYMYYHTGITNGSGAKSVQLRVQR